MVIVIGKPLAVMSEWTFQSMFLMMVFQRQGVADNNSSGTYNVLYCSYRSSCQRKISALGTKNWQRIGIISS